MNALASIPLERQDLARNAFAAQTCKFKVVHILIISIKNIFIFVEKSSGATVRDFYRFLTWQLVQSYGQYFGIEFENHQGLYSYVEHKMC